MISPSSFSLNSFPAVNILVVDDNPHNLVAMQAALKDLGYTLIEAHSGLEALEHIKNYDFACILLDVQMPVMDGFETAKWIRREARSRATPIIFATANHRTEEYEQLGYIAGAVDYLFKPINTSILNAKVAIFVELFLQSEELKKKNILLEEAIDRIKENEQLKQALAARDEFLLMASHELKTPITPLNLQMETFIQLFEQGDFRNFEPERLLRMLRTSHGQVQRLDRLINELIDVSRLSRNKLELNVAMVDLRLLTEKVIDDFAEEIKKSECLVTFHASQPLMGCWDAFRVEQVIINLLINALKYGEKKPIEIYLSSQDDQAILCIRDQGIGIAKDHLERIFHRFERAVSGNSYSGLGLGLYISHEIVSLHRGKIWVESEPTVGSRFFVQLPLS